MGKPLPTGNFQWVLGRELEKFSDPDYILQLDSHGSTCYFLEVWSKKKKKKKKKKKNRNGRWTWTTIQSFMIITMSSLLLLKQWQWLTICSALINVSRQAGLVLQLAVVDQRSSSTFTTKRIMYCISGRLTNVWLMVVVVVVVGILSSIFKWD